MLGYVLDDGINSVFAIFFEVLQFHIIKKNFPFNLFQQVWIEWQCNFLMLFNNSIFIKSSSTVYNTDPIASY